MKNNRIIIWNLLLVLCKKWDYVLANKLQRSTQGKEIKALLEVTQTVEANHGDSAVSDWDCFGVLPSEIRTF